MHIVKSAIAALLGMAVIGPAGFLIFGPAIAEKGMNTVVAHDDYSVSTQARTFHQSLTIGDWHADSLLWNRDLLKRADYGHVDFARLAEGNVAIQVFTTVTQSPAGLNYDENAATARDQITLLGVLQIWPVRTWNSRIERALYQASRMQGYEQEAPGRVRILRTKSDLAEVLAARANGKPLTGALLGAEGGHALDKDQANLGRLYEAGFRLMGLQHFFDNALGGSLHGQTSEGLTEFGLSVIAEMAERHMIIDLAHSSPAVVRDVLGALKVPVVLSHTGIHGHCAVKRNIPDELMQQIAARGGLIGIGYWADVTCDASPDGIAKTIRAAIDLVGADHVALGSDFDGVIETSFDTSELAALTDALLRAGISRPDIAKVMGANTVAFLSRMLPD